MAKSKLKSVPRAEFDGVYRRQVAFVWRMLRYHGIAESAVEDAVQDVFVVVHRRWHDWDRETGERAWLFSIARRVAAAHRRSNARHQRRLTVAPPPGGPAPVDEVVENREALAALERVLASMDEKLRTAFVLAVIEGMSVPEISQSTGAKLNTIYSRVRVAKAQVAAAMQDKRERKTS